MLSFLSNCKSVSQSRYTILHSCQLCLNGLVSLQHYWHLLLAVFSISGILLGLERDYTVVLT